MRRFRQQDYRAALEFIETIGGAPDLDDFARTLVSRLSSVVPADITAYNEVNPVLRRAFFTSDLDIEGAVPDATMILERHMGENPLVVYHATARDSSAHMWSEFISQRQLHRTALWNGLFRPLSIERQMVATLPAPEPLLIGVVLHRTGRDFSERDRDMLNLLRPHLANAYANAQARAVFRVIGSSEQAVIILGALGDPLAVTPHARHLVAPFGDSGPAHLPELLLEWCRRMRARMPLPPEPLVLRHGTRTVEARYLSDYLVTLRRLSDRLDPASLRSLGLAPRERDVLALVAEGLANKDVALRLSIETATVKKHLENIYEKLHVTTRTAAAATAFRAADLSDSDCRTSAKRDSFFGFEIRENQDALRSIE